MGHLCQDIPIRRRGTWTGWRTENGGKDGRVASLGITQLISDLLYAVQALAGYSAPVQTPAVEFVPHLTLEEMACEGHCDIRGWYAGGGTIYLDDHLDPANNLWDRSIVVHEMVHYLQDRAGAFGAVPTCRRWIEREEEAYAVQRRWLRKNPPRRPAPVYARFSRMIVDCDS